jgi:hypothetical protein
MPMIHQHQLACLLGVEGVALLHAFAGEYERYFTEARLAESGRCWTQPTSRFELAAAP